MTLVAIFASLALTTSAGPAVAEPIAVDFTGIVTGISNFSGPPPMTSGQAVSGQFIYEPIGGLDRDGRPNIYFYEGFTISSFSIWFTGYEASLDPTSAEGYVGISIAPSNYASLVFRGGASGATIHGDPPQFIQFGLTDFPYAGVIQGRLPTLEDWDDYQVLLPAINLNFMTFGEPVTGPRVDWRVTSYYVPEPGSAIMLGVGALALALASSARRR